MEAVRNRDLQREVKRKQQLHNAGKNNYRKNGYQEQLPDWAKILRQRKNKLLHLVKANPHKFQVI